MNLKNPTLVGGRKEILPGYPGRGRVRNPTRSMGKGGTPGREKEGNPTRVGERKGTLHGYGEGWETYPGRRKEGNHNRVGERKGTLPG